MTPALLLLSVALAVTLPHAGAYAFPILLATIRCVQAALVYAERGAPRQWVRDLSSYVVQPSRLVPWAAGVLLGGRSLDLWPDLPALVAVPLVAVVLDVEQYAMHRAAHTSPVLWRFHAWHHASEAPTAMNRRWSHPLDVTLWGLGGLGLVAVGCPVAVLAGAMGLQLTAMLQHCHADLPDHGLGRWLLLGAHHRQHHDDGGRAVWCGLWLTVWDRIFGTADFSAPPALRVER
jgi:sterol desaturase/sphingolipid hydroxylase (fatty acid hydroxylase superfamily)